ncbi:cholinesterase-like [Oppia nitens]|uniref:cholinesterase-like n=1 Tax=Oppia nitens TaxID=1686743 RepID=UPI0023DC22BC|nr:cholinesterase-like [Oppia nitens]
MQGQVRGQLVDVLNTTVRQFLNIPYAEPPVGPLRFGHSVPLSKPKPNIIDGTKRGNLCYQSPDTHDPYESEDCLVLNIWTPNAKTKSNIKPKPVMFWLYGGGLNTGSIFGGLYDGHRLAATQDVIVVTANYRLGKLGFLYGADNSAPGNAGLSDQIMALRWIRDNIQAFGGDRDRVTVFGQSAGSRSISALIVSPESKGLFRRVILESGSFMHWKQRGSQTTSEALQEAQSIARQLNCTVHDNHTNNNNSNNNTDDKQWLDCLRKCKPTEFSKFYKEFTFPLDGTSLLPIPIQQAFESGKYTKGLDIMAGVTLNEGSTLAMGGYPLLQKNITESDFLKLIGEVDNTYHGLDVQRVADHYLAGVDRKSPESLRLAFFDFFGDIHVKCPLYLFSRQYARLSHNSSRQQQNNYFYELTYQSKLAKMWGCGDGMGICHGSEIEFVFGVPLTMNDTIHTKVDKEFSLYVMKLWTDFAKNGKPDTTGTWPLFLSRDDSPDQHMYIKDLNPYNKTRVFTDLFKNSCDTFWYNYYL